MVIDGILHQVCPDSPERLVIYIPGCKPEWGSCRFVRRSCGPCEDERGEEAEVTSTSKGRLHSR